MPEEAAAAPAAPPTAPATDRHAWTDRLWGSGHLLPGGDTEALRLAALLPLSPQTTLLLVGAGAGGAAAAIAGARGTFVAAHDASLAGRQRAAPPLRKLARRVTLEPWNPAAPEFRPAYHHHALLLEPLRQGGTPEALFAGLGPALRPDAQIVLLELVLRQPAARGLDRWCALEARGLPPTEATVSQALRHAGYEVHVTEDAGPRQVQAVLEGWTQLVTTLDGEGQGPAAGEAATLVAEAEAWLLRLRLLREGRIALVRWHASLRRG